MPKKLFAVASILLMISVSALLLTGFLPGSKTIAYGCFHQVAHKGTGCAALVRKSDGQTFLHLTDFRTAKNDDLQILLISANDALENETVKNSERLFVAPLEKSEGSQTYSVPADENLSKYNSVVIWQGRHGVNFTTAPLRGCLVNVSPASCWLSGGHLARRLTPNSILRQYGLDASAGCQRFQPARSWRYIFIDLPNNFLKNFEISGKESKKMFSMKNEEPVQWLEQYGDYLYAFALSRLHNETIAEDFVQETLLSAYESREKFAENSSVKTWLTAILKHKIFDHYRRSIRQVSFDSEAEETAFFDETGHWRESLSDWNLTPEKLFEQKEFQTILQSCLADLPENLAAVFTLREIEGLGTKEICGILSISQNNLWVLLHRARLRLRQAVENRCFGINTQTEILNHTSEIIFSI